MCLHARLRLICTYRGENRSPSKRQIAIDVGGTWKSGQLTGCCADFSLLFRTVGYPARYPPCVQSSHAPGNLFFTRASEIELDAHLRIVARLGRSLEKSLRNASLLLDRTTL